MAIFSDFNFYNRCGVIMVEQVNFRTRQYNYNTINSVKSAVNTSDVKNLSVTPTFTASVPITSKAPQVASLKMRTTLDSKEEKNEYTTILSQLDKNGRKIVDNLLKTGVLLNSDSNDHSTVLDNLYKIYRKPCMKVILTYHVNNHINHTQSK